MKTQRMNRWGAWVMGAILLGLVALASPARALDLWPLAEFSDDQTTVLYPFYDHEGPFMMVFPFYLRTNQGHDHHIVWPLVKVSNGRLTRAMPVWYNSDADTFTVFPLMYQSPETTIWTVPPMQVNHDGNYFALYPLYWYSRSPAQTKATVPLLYHQTWGAKESSLWALPYYHSVTPAERSTAIVPFYAQSKATTGTLDRLFYLFPYLSSSSTESSFHSVFPFYYQSAEKGGDQEKEFYLFPYLQTTSKTEFLSGVLPLYLYHSEEQGRHRTFNLLWPLYRREIVDREDGTVESYHRRFLIFSESKEKSGTRTISLLGCPVVERTK